MERVLRLAGWARSAHQLTFDFELDGLGFRTAYWYGDVDLLEVEERLGAEAAEQLWFHIGAFEINKIASLAPERVDFGRFAAHVTPEFERLWRTVFTKVWAQWRYENSLPDYTGPAMNVTGETRGASVAVEPGDVGVLAFCGGGKDSLVALDLLEEAHVPYATLGYSSSAYGRADVQHGLIDELLGHFAPAARHRQWIFDDFLDSPVLELGAPHGITTMTAAETPASMFAALPIAIAHGYTSLCFAHEKSADVGNLTWSETGEEVNHQWGKSTQAETLLDDYIRSELVANVRTFSILKPIHDVVIFNALNRRLDAVPSTHSCNVSKPWCGRCAKCAYVYLSYAAYLPEHVVDEVFGANFFDVPENDVHFRQLLGLVEHTPFECVGQVEESTLALQLCANRGLPGRAVEELAPKIDLEDPVDLLETFAAVDTGYARMPAALERVPTLLEARAAEGRERVRSWLASGG